MELRQLTINAHLRSINICAYRGLPFGCGPIKNSPHLLENFGEDIPTSMGVTEAQTLNFKQNFKFSQLIFFWGGGPPSQLGCAVGSLGQSVARVKI